MKNETSLVTASGQQFGEAAAEALFDLSLGGNTPEAIAAFLSAAVASFAAQAAELERQRSTICDHSRPHRSPRRASSF